MKRVSATARSNYDFTPTVTQPLNLDNTVTVSIKISKITTNITITVDNIESF